MGLGPSRGRPHRWLDELTPVAAAPRHLTSRAASGDAGRCGQDADRRAACARSNHGPPSIAVTRAPPRSAISPAAATSHADNPPCWMKASKRPLPTYASARAAEPIEREMRIARRTARDRLAAALPAERQRDDEVGDLVLVRRRDGVARRPERPSEHGRAVSGRREVSPRVGSWITPTDGRPSTTSAIDTQKNGMPFA